MKFPAVLLAVFASMAVACSDESQPLSSADIGLDAGPGQDAAVKEPTDAPQPPAPVYDDSVGLITLSVRTIGGVGNGTDDPIQVCLGENLCFEPNVPDVDDRQPGEVDVYHLPVSIDRNEIDRLTLETLSDPSTDNDQWTPLCIDIRIDGEPIYCQDDIGVKIGTGDGEGEVTSWADPDGISQDCVSCWRDTITHGPLIGPPTEDSVRVKVRTDATRLTGLRLGETADLSDGLIVDWAYPVPEDDFTANLVATDLKPGTTYYYRVEVESSQSQPIRAIRTAPEPGTLEPVRIAFGSCTREVRQPIFEKIIDTDPDMFFFVGDNNYANTYHLDALRWHYRQFRRVGGRARLVANTPIWANWDDHDFLDNNSNGTCLNRDKALQAFREAWANPQYGLPDTPGTFFKSSWGAVDIFNLDCRMYRPDTADFSNRCERDPNPPALSIDDGPLGPEQEAWLFDELAQSEATFKLLICGSRFTPDGSRDSWARFPEAFDRLLAHLTAESISGVAFMSGDIHRSVFSRIPGGPYIIPEFVSSPLANSTGNCANDSTQISCYDSGNSWVELAIDPTLDDPTITATMYDEQGAEITSIEWTLSQLSP